MDRGLAARLGRETVDILRAGSYLAPSGQTVDVRAATDLAIAGTVTYPPGEALQRPDTKRYSTGISVRNETTLVAAREILATGRAPVALNFASASHPGGGFLSGARAQEESLARSSGLFACLDGNPMYAWQAAHHAILYSDYAIYSPGVPIFRADAGVLLEEPYQCAFITCAAVNANTALERDPHCRPAIYEAMRRRIDRVLAIAAAHGHTHVILGAWGCGAFGNDPAEIAALFREALHGPYDGAFAAVLFAITDWSLERRFIGPFERALA